MKKSLLTTIALALVPFTYAEPVDNALVVVEKPAASIASRSPTSAPIIKRIKVAPEHIKLKQQALSASGQYLSVEPDYTVTNASEGFNDPDIDIQSYFNDIDDFSIFSPEFYKANAHVESNIQPRVAVIDGSFGMVNQFEDMNPVFETSIMDRTTTIDGESVTVSRGDTAYDSEIMLSCQNGHGVGVASIIGATRNDGIGLAGAADVELGYYRVLLCGEGSGYEVSQAIIHAAGGEIDGIATLDEPFDIINLSLGSQSACASFTQQAINFARSRGVVVVTGAGNGGIEATEFTPGNCEGTLNVGAVESVVDDLADFSNYGDKLTLVAQGAYNGGYSTSFDSGLAVWQGTSFSAPLVSASIALAKSVTPNITEDDIVKLLSLTAQSTMNRTQCATLGCGLGVLNANRFVLAVQNVRDSNFGELTPAITEGELCDMDAYLSIEGIRERLCSQYRLSLGEVLSARLSDKHSANEVLELVTRAQGEEDWSLVAQMDTVEILVSDINSSNDYGVRVCRQAGDCSTAPVYALQVSKESLPEACL